MRGLLIALLLGLAAAAAALFAFREGGEPRELARPAPLAPAPASTAVAAVSVPPQAPAPAARPPGAALAASTVAPTLVRAAVPEASPVLHSAFALSSDHRTLIQGTLLAAADHELLEHEPRDDAWATEAERLIRQELARHHSADAFDIVTVDCRQTLCAIQAFSHGENGHRQWVEVMDELYRETLASTFDSVNTAFPDPGSGRSPVLTFLHRKPVAPKRRAGRPAPAGLGRIRSLRPSRKGGSTASAATGTT